MFQLDPLGLINLIPKGLKQKALDTLVDFVSEQAQKYASDELASRIKKLRSDASFQQTFAEGWQRATKRFVDEYKIEDEDLVAAIVADETGKIVPRSSHKRGYWDWQYFQGNRGDGIILQVTS